MNVIMKKASWCVYIIVRFLVRVFYRKPQLEGLEHLPDGPCVIVGNHARMNGPIIANLYIPGDRAIWCNEEMMHLKEVPAYAYKDFWSQKPRYIRWFYRIMSYLIAPLAVCIFNNGLCIGVYRDLRIMATLRESVEKLQEGYRIIIFPEQDVYHNGIVWDFQIGFTNVARMYAKKTGKELLFVPMYVAPKLKKVCFGEPVPFDNSAETKAEQRRVCDRLMEAITELALSQPPHELVPYPNRKVGDGSLIGRAPSGNGDGRV